MKKPGAVLSILKDSEMQSVSNWRRVWAMLRPDLLKLCQPEIKPTATEIYLECQSRASMARGNS
jgi:hypothetical protein